MRIITFNSRTQVVDDKENSYPFRYKLIFDYLKNIDSDIICFQEVTHLFEKDIKNNLSDKYSFFGGYRFKEYKDFDETCLIAYKKDRFECIKFYHYWLSPTPDIAESKFVKDTFWPRVACEILLKDKKTNKTFYVTNTHFELDAYSCSMAFKLIDERIKKTNNFHHFLCGDLNQNPLFYSKLNSNLIDLTNSIPYSFHEYGKTKEKIDYIFVNKNVFNLSVKLDEIKDNNVFISDHFPIRIDFEF